VKDPNVRSANITFNDHQAGILVEDDDGYHFTYDEEYLRSSQAVAISMTLPLREAAFDSPILFPFFDGLIPEGWLLNIAERNWKMQPRDRMGLLLVCCEDCIGAVGVRAIHEAPE